jgi:protein-tyrosine phosphatase
MREQGCTALLTLLSEREGAKAIGEAALRVGIAWLWLPLASGDPPADERDVEVRAVFAGVCEQLSAGGRVLVHCSAGIHRTGMVAYGLLRHLGRDPKDARTILRALRTFTAEGVGEGRLAWGEKFGYPSSLGNTRDATGT